jgi:DNA-binding CsgD family transcriptional regulator
MNSDEDKAAVLAVIKAETAAFMRKDIEALSEHWVHSPEARRIAYVANLGLQVFEGWEAIKDNYVHLIEQFPEIQPETRVHAERMNVVVIGDMAWANYDQIGSKASADDKFELGGTMHEIKIFHRIAGQWKMACIIVIQCSVAHVSAPLIEIDSNKEVLWMNGYAHEQVIDHPFLIISGNKLRARNRLHEAGLQDAVTWAKGVVQTHWTKEPLDRLARAVILGESDDASPQFCWVLVEDGKILVSFNDDQMVSRRVALAQGIYGLTATQAQVAQLLVQGNDIVIVAKKLGVTANTVRTHLQRMFDRTGVRSQTALVAILLSAEAPTARSLCALRNNWCHRLKKIFSNSSIRMTTIL